MRLFINYAHSDKTAAEQIVNFLLAHGCDCWFEKLLPKQDWEAELLAAITQCDGMIHMLSPESIVNQWCQWELAHAVRLGKPVLPLVVRMPVDLPSALDAHSWIDVSEGLDENTLEPLLDDLKSLQRFILSSNTVLHAPEHPHGIPAQAMESNVPPGMRPGRDITED